MDVLNQMFRMCNLTFQISDFNTGILTHRLRITTTLGKRLSYPEFKAVLR